VTYTWWIFLLAAWSLELAVDISVALNYLNTGQPLT